MSLYVSAIIWRLKEGRHEVLIQRSISLLEHRRSKVTFPGGMTENGNEERNPILALRREILEELWVLVKWKAAPLPLLFSPSHKSWALKEEDLVGDIRTVEMNDNTSRLFPPEWVPAEEAGRYLIAPHQRPLLVLLNKFKLVAA
jgi:8-oxo-dGTP pyrophosphatase MutT (NUDIX family)